MKSSSHIHDQGPARGPRLDAPAPAAGEGGLVQGWLRFWFSPTDPLVLHGLRVLGGLLFLVWLLTLAGQRHALFGLDGWFDQKAYVETNRIPGGSPQPLTWSLTYLAKSPGALEAVYWGSVAAIALFTVGVLPRLTGVLTWLAVASFTASPIAGSDADPLLLLLAFYLAVGYLLVGLSGNRSWLNRILGPVLVWPLRPAPEGEESAGANVAVRLIQVHLAVVIVVSGLHKLQFGDWWAGLALWYPLYPPMETTLAQARQHAGPGAESYLAMLNVAGYAALAWQIGFPLYAWRPRFRWVLLTGAFVGWVSMAFIYQVPLFGEALFIGLLAFCSPAGVRGLLSRLSRRSASAAATPGAVVARQDRTVHVMGAS